MPQALNVAFVGSGRAGRTLAYAAHKRGYNLLCITDVNPEQLSKLPDEVPQSARHTFPPRAELLASADLLVVAVPDAEIANTANTLAELAKQNQIRFEHTTVVHLSGALPSTVLAPLAELGATLASLHPLVSFTDTVLPPDQLRGALAAIEGDAKGSLRAQQFARALGFDTFTIEPKVKPLYHAAAVMASNLSVALAHLALQTCSRAGIEDRYARKLISDLMSTTVQRIKTDVPMELAQSGPFFRSEIETIRTELNALQGSGLVEQVFRVLGLVALELSIAGRGPRLGDEEIRALLTKEE